MMIKFVTLCSAAMMFIGFNAQAAKTCTVGKPCGDSCISQNDVCHIGTSSSRGLRSIFNRSSHKSEDVAQNPHRTVHPKKESKSVARRSRKADNVSSGSTRESDESMAKRSHKKRRHHKNK